MVSNCLACPLQKNRFSLEKKNLELSRHATEMVWHATHAHSILHSRLSGHSHSGLAHAGHLLTKGVLKRHYQKTIEVYFSTGAPGMPGICAEFANMS